MSGFTLAVRHLELLLLVVPVGDRAPPAEWQDGVGLGGVGPLERLVGLLVRWPGSRPGAEGLLVRRRGAGGTARRRPGCVERPHRGRQGDRARRGRPAEHRCRRPGTVLWC